LGKSSPSKKKRSAICSALPREFSKISVVAGAMEEKK